MDDINFFVLKFKSGFCHWTIVDLTIDLNLETKRGILVVGKGSWKKREVRILSWKVQNEAGKNEVGKFEPKLENF